MCRSHTVCTFKKISELRDPRYPLTDEGGVRAIEACMHCGTIDGKLPAEVQEQRLLNSGLRPLTEEERAQLAEHHRKIRERTEAARKLPPIPLPGTPKREPMVVAAATVTPIESRKGNPFRT